VPVPPETTSSALRSLHRRLPRLLGRALLPCALTPAIAQTAAEAPLPIAPEAPAYSISLDDGHWARQNIFKRVVSDQKYLVTEWWPDDFHNAAFTAPLLVATIGAFGSSSGNGEDRFDQDISGQTQGNTHGRSIGVAKTFSTLGDGAPGLIGIGATYLIARWTDNARLADTMSLSTEALVDSGIWVTGLKTVFARTRPEEGGQGRFFQFEAPSGKSTSSFPSGHAMGAFTVATVVSKMYPEKKWVPWVFYGTAGAVAASRVALGRHYATDVVVGGLLGNSIGRMVVSRERGSEEPGPASLQNFRPIIDPAGGRFGLVYQYSW
jgi:hypothetical protein